MGMPSGFELFIIVAIVVLLFGGKKIPELAKGLGKGIKDFKNAVKEDEKDSEIAVNDKKIEEDKAEATTASKTETAENKTDNKTV
jgi:sec-independent protein translocase protein TatA